MTSMPVKGHIGEAINRVDGRLKVTGAAKYAAEHPVDGLLYGWVVSSSIAKGKIIAINEEQTRAVDGVVEVVTHKNRPDLAWLDRSYEDEVSVPGSPFRALYDENVVYSLQPIAVVVANSLESAREGAALLSVEYEVAPHNTDLDVALAEKFVPKRTNAAFQRPKDRGDAKAAFDEAPLKISGQYRHSNHHHNPMEMHATTVIWEGDGRITVYDKNQGSQNVQAYLSSIFGFSKKKLRVLNPFVGGAFGSGLRPQYQVYLATMAAKMLERSVRIVLTRQQMFSHVRRPEVIQNIALATTESGRLHAMKIDATTPTSRFEHYMETVVNWGMMAYACENAAGEYSIAPMDTYTPGDMRAPGAASGMTLFEIAMDEMAYAAKLDPLTFRILNYSDVNAMDGKPYTSKALRQAYDEGAARFGWTRRTSAPRSMKEGRELIGMGVATGVWDAMFMKTAAKATLRADGTLEVSNAGSDIGTGTYTIMTQVAAETLGVALDQVTAVVGDSSLSTTPVEGGSWGAASSGAAVALACKAVGEQLLKAAKKMDDSPFAKASIDDVGFADAAMFLKDSPAATVSFATLMQSAGVTEMTAEETASPSPLDLVSMMKKARNTHSAIFVEVRVDEELGVVRVTRVVAAIAAGRIVNPKTARSQILGGVVMGIGMALHEETLTDHALGRFMNHSYAEYHIPANADIDEIEVIFVDEPDAEVTPLGIKGVGEIGIVSTAAAVANAIYHATGARIQSLPITIDKILEAEGALQQS